MGLWNAIMGAGANLIASPGGILNTPVPSGASMVAPTTDPMLQYFNNANAIGNVNPYYNVINPSGQVGGQDAGAMWNLSQGFNMPYYNSASFTPNQGTLNGIAAWGNQLFGNIPQVQGQFNVGYDKVSAPGAIQQLSGLPQVSAPGLNYFQMNPVANIGPQQSWTDPGVSQKFMSPYTQNVIDTQLAQAKVQEQQQLQQQAADATRAGAFGGSRQAVEAANTSIGYQQMAAALEAQGLQNAYTQGAQQFNTQQQVEMQRLLANQQAGLTTSGQNLAANLQTQGLGAQMNMQGQLANQQTALQSGIANQQAEEFGHTQQMQASLANQAAGIQTGLANAQYGLQGQMANQAAAMQAKGLQYQGGVQAAQQQQALELQGQLAGAQLGSQNAQIGQALQQQGLMNVANLQGTGAGLLNQGYTTYLQGLAGLGQAGGAAQGLAQMLPDANLSSYLMQQQLPMQSLAALATLLAMRPLPYNMAQQGQFSGQGTTTSTPSMLSQIGGIGSLIGGFLAKGGRVPTGIEKYRSKGSFGKSRYQTGGVADASPASSSSGIAAPSWQEASGLSPAALARNQQAWIASGKMTPAQYQQAWQNWEAISRGPGIIPAADAQAPTFSSAPSGLAQATTSPSAALLQAETGLGLGAPNPTPPAVPKPGMARGGLESTEGGSTVGERSRLRSIRNMREVM